MVPSEMHLMTPNALMAELPIKDKWILAINRSVMSKSWDYLNRNQMFGWVWWSSVDEKGPLLYMVKKPNL